MGMTYFCKCCKTQLSMDKYHLTGGYCVGCRYAPRKELDVALLAIKQLIQDKDEIEAQLKYMREKDLLCQPARGAHDWKCISDRRHECSQCGLDMNSQRSQLPCEGKPAKPDPYMEGCRDGGCMACPYAPNTVERLHWMDGAREKISGLR